MPGETMVAVAVAVVPGAGGAERVTVGIPVYPVPGLVTARAVTFNVEVAAAGVKPAPKVTDGALM